MKTEITLRMDSHHEKKYRQMIRGSESFDLAPTKLQKCKGKVLKLSRIDYFLLGVMSTMALMAYYWVQ